MEEEEVLKAMKGDLMVEHVQKQPSVREEEPLKEKGKIKGVGKVVVCHHYLSIDSTERKKEMKRK